MTRLFNKMLQCLLLLSIAGSVFSQEIIRGSITYVSAENAFVDLGKKTGVTQGDSLRIERGPTILGWAVITQSSGSSSAIQAAGLENIDWKIGDVVIFTMPESKMVSTSIQDTAVVPSTARPVTRVFLDSSAYQARSRSNMSLDSDRFSPAFTGYISTRIDDRGGNANTTRISSGSVYGQFKIQDLGFRHLDASVYMRGRQSTKDDTFDGKLYSVMFSYDNPGKQLSYLFGRMYHPQFSSLGTMDGIGITWRTSQISLAVVGGAEANITSIDSPNQRSKFGLLGERRFSMGNFQVGTISELEGSELSREYLILGSSLRFKQGIRVRAYSEIDLDLFDQSTTQGAVSITRFRTSLNWRPLRSLLTSVRYSYRENVIDLLDTARTEFDEAVRHSLNTSMSWLLRSGLTLSAQANYRSDGSSRHIKIYGFTMNQRDFTSLDFNMNAGGMAMSSYLSEGGRVYASIGKRVLPWLDIDFYDEIFMYKILGEDTFRTRHLPEISLGARVTGLQRLKLRSRFEQEDGQTFYRISLSASRRF